MADTFVQVAPDSTGKQLRTISGSISGQTVHQQVVIPTSMRTRTGLYYANSGALTLLAAAHSTTAGFFWLINPVGSTTAVALKRVKVMTQGTAAALMPSSPRITVERMTFTGTASGATITPGKRVRTGIGGLTADATNVASLRTASTGLTPTAGETLRAFLPAISTSATGSGVYSPPSTDAWDPDSEDGEVILAAGEGIICRQADAGTTSDSRKLSVDVTWEEFTAP